MAEARFYSQYVKPCGLKYEIHKSYKLIPIFQLPNGLRYRSLKYSPDFVIHLPDRKLILDIKPSFSNYNQTAAIMRMKMFSYKYQEPVIIVTVPAKSNYFRYSVFGTTKKIKPMKATNVREIEIEAG